MSERIRTAHELAKMLLNGPDVPVLTYGFGFSTRSLCAISGFDSSDAYEGIAIEVVLSDNDFGDECDRLEKGRA